MARPILLCSAPWADVPLEELVLHAAEWGYQGLDLCCWGDHFEVQRASAEEDYCPDKLALLGRQELLVPVLSQHRVSQAVADVLDDRHREGLPDYVWGDGRPDGVRERAVEEMLATCRAAQALGVSVLTGGTGSPLTAALLGPGGPEAVADGLRDLARHWAPILDACGESGLRYAAQVQPGQAAFDLASAEMVLEALGGREEFGFALDPAALHWQGVDPVEFV